MVLTEMNTPTAVYCHNRLGYDIVCSPAWIASNGGVQGGVGLVLWDRPTGWSFELMCFHRPTVVSYKVITGT